MFIPYEIFYKRNVVRLPQHLMLPFMPTIDKFNFPLSSVHHYSVWDSVLSAPESNEYFYRGVQKKIFVEHVTTLLGDPIGNPKRIAIQVMPLIRQYHMRNKRFRYSEHATEVITDPQTLVVVNYGFVPKTYRYIRSMYADYYRWWNLQKTMWTKATEVASVSKRHQFIFTELPQRLPSLSMLNMHAAKFSERTVRKLGGPSGWFMLEMWKWISQEYRSTCVIGDLSQETLDKINIVFQESGRYAIINLGTLNSWRFLKDEIGTDEQKVKIKPVDMQKRFLKLCMTMMTLRTGLPEGVPEEAEEVEVVNDGTNDIQIAPTIDLAKVDADERTTHQLAQDMLDSIDADMAALEELNRKDDTEDDVVETDDVTSGLKSKTPVEYDLDMGIEEMPEDVIKGLCDDLADTGALTASEYRRFVNLSVNYKTIPSPFTSESLAEFATIKAEDVKIDTSYKFKDIPTVSDKSMLSNSLIEFDEVYIKKVLNKDIASMITNSQKGGFVINKYDVERIENISGKFDIHTVRITPVEGQSSTLRFSIPVIDDEGVYVSGGVKYRMRKQRGDKPLRKTNPDRVAMTTYFGKTFVSRNDKRVNDYGSWLRETIMKKGMDSQDPDISGLSPANVFDNNYSTGRIYSSIAQGFKSFDSGGYHFIFDRNSEAFSDEAKKNNKGGTTVVAVNDNGEHLVVDKNNVLYKIQDAGLVPLGSFETFLNISNLTAPVDFAQIKVYGKNLPVGLVLGYMYGIDNLINKLKVNPRRVAAGQRLNLQDNEFSVAFSDETLIFSRDDQLASLIFGGFKEFEKSVKNYSVHTFDKKNVYLNVFESQGISVRYLREVEMFNDLFVDPISRELLVKDNLPTTFPGMLLKATEWLTVDAHPDTLDMNHMRIKGYERMAGAVYAEICQSVREHKTKSGRKHQQVEMNPHAVWRRISRDPSVSTASGINPIKNLKEKESVTYNGVGGRTSRSMVRNTRSYHPNDMGVISESTVDSSDVGINTFLTADPQFDSLRGTSRPYVIGKTGATALLSTSAQVSVGSTHDD